MIMRINNYLTNNYLAEFEDNIRLGLSDYELSALFKYPVGLLF